MAVRFDAVGDQLNRTANLPPNSSFTYMMWAVIDNELGAGTYQPYLWALDATSQQGYACGVVNGIFDIECYNGGAISSTSSVASRPTAGQAACIYVRCSGTGANLINSGYRLSTANAFVSSGTATLGSLNVMTQLYMGGLFGAYWIDGRRWNIKAWDRALTDAEILAESYFERVIYPASLNFYLPLPNSGDTADRSGNGRNPTVVGTLTTGDSAVNLWRPSQKIFVPQAVVQNQTLAFTLDDIASTVNQALTHPQTLAIGLDGVTVAAAQVLLHPQTLSATLDGVVISVAQTAAHPQSLAITLEGVDVAINQAIGAGNSQTIGFTLDGVTAAAAQTVSHPQSLAAALDGVVVAVAQVARHPQSLAVTLDGVSASVVQGLRHSQALAATLDSISVQIAQEFSSPNKDQSLAVTLDDVSVSISQQAPESPEEAPTYVVGKKPKAKERKLMGGPRWQRHELGDLSSLITGRPYEEAEREAEKQAQNAIAKASQQQEITEITGTADALALLANNEALEAQALKAAILAEQQALEDAQIMAIIAELL